ncbi:TraK family protein [Comamonas endophytica]|uniref:TraK family protein n=1 Tax=Comamonas endophytica TaxID=2949090 RepID=A0ABY6GGE7_9BURK|nr:MULTISPECIES: TraK family protein [unclassified Acidovorax]MCD2514649.1 TraK family protein [Acidovorax sp. D4N7]UYG53961.1 TraK family protein [Acidovorax sp. 5MLIR]UYG54000.1 TraK family protein [Acidovorax sp. 5MLIR]
MQDQPTQAQRGQGRVAFLALLEKFRTLLLEGHSLLTIHKDHQQQLGISYPQFTKYINRYLSAEVKDRHQKEISVGLGRHLLNASRMKNHSLKTQKKPAGNPNGFTYNPNSGNSRGDLI